MWPLYPLSNTIVGITITSTYLSCSWIHQMASEYFVKAYTKQVHNDYEVMDLIMYNSSKIRETIRQFVRNNNVDNAYAVFAIENSQNISRKQFIMQYQLLAVSIPLNCIMVTAYDSALQAVANSSALTFSNSCSAIPEHEVLHNIGLYIIGKKLL